MDYLAIETAAFRQTVKRPQTGHACIAGPAGVFAFSAPPLFLVAEWQAVTFSYFRGATYSEAFMLVEHLLCSALSFQ